jgi:Tfp pilus assembly protein FimT
VIAIVGILAALGFTNGRAMAESQRARGALATFQQSIWQGATAAASRGVEVVLEYDGADLALRDPAADRVIRTFELPPTVSTNLPTGVALRFLPPGKVEEASLLALPDDLSFDTGRGVYDLRISIIGEVVAEASP